MSKILSVKAAERLDSRGKPTVQVLIRTDRGVFSALVPSGASKGDYEAVELRDNDPTRFLGQGVLKAVENVNAVIGPRIVAESFVLPRDVEAIDEFLVSLDGTADKGRLGANAVLGVSMAAYRAAAAVAGEGGSEIPLYEFVRRCVRPNSSQQQASKYVMPVPFFNVLNGGAHSGGTMPFQEFMIAPVGATSTSDAIRIGSEVYWTLKKIVINKFGNSASGVGDEGGLAPLISQPHEALDLLVEAVKECGHEHSVAFAIDPASQEFFSHSDGKYNMSWKQTDVAQDMAKRLSRDEMIKLYHGLLDKYNIVLLEDPFAQDDWETWTKFCRNGQVGVELVGDDLLATNRQRISMAREKQACNGLLLKINQIGTVSEAIAAAKQAYSYDWSVFVSHRSGETTDDFIADLTVGLGTGHLKSGSPARGERVAKYNRLMDIEQEIREQELEYRYAGREFSRCR